MLNKFLLDSTGNDTQYPVINCNGKEDEKEYMHACLKHFAVPETTAL